MARGRELRAQGMKDGQVDSVRFAEVKRGKLRMPKAAALYSLTGKKESWEFEGAAAPPMVAAGISPQLLKVGNHIKIIAHPARDASKRTAEFMGMEVNGKYYARGTETNVRDK